MYANLCSVFVMSAGPSDVHDGEIDPKEPESEQEPCAYGDTVEITLAVVLVQETTSDTRYYVVRSPGPIAGVHYGLHPTCWLQLVDLLGGKPPFGRKLKRCDSLDSALALYISDAEQWKLPPKPTLFHHVNGGAA